MMVREMIWTAWNNGSHHPSGSGYGLRVPITDRDAHMRRSQRTIILELPSESGRQAIELNIGKDSFWSETCRELISKELGKWFIEYGYALWPKGYPPRFEIIKKSERLYCLMGEVAR